MGVQLGAIRTSKALLTFQDSVDIRPYGDRSSSPCAEPFLLEVGNGSDAKQASTKPRRGPQTSPIWSRFSRCVCCTTLGGVFI